MAILMFWISSMGSQCGCIWLDALLYTKLSDRNCSRCTVLAESHTAQPTPTRSPLKQTHKLPSMREVSSFQCPRLGRSPSKYIGLNVAYADCALPGVAYTEASVWSFLSQMRSVAMRDPKPDSRYTFDAALRRHIPGVFGRRVSAADT